ncbi:MAG: hypothetical protein IJE51_04000 [Clostridia bacterium]|nr:hypothetical protein [Clostridia bacterium]
MRKTVILLALISMISVCAIPFSATEDLGESEYPTIPALSSTITPVRIGNDCLCGREYYTENVGEHSKYDCIKCGKNMYACTCNCWCGASTVLDTTGAYGGVSPRLCSGCNKPCPECDCRDDKAEVLAAEKLRLNGEVSPLNLPRPENGWNLFFAMFTILVLVSASVILPQIFLFTKRSSVSEEDIAITDILSINSEDELSKKPEKAYETPENERSDVKKNVVRPVQTKNIGVSVYEKINIPWMASAKNTVNINCAAAKVITNDTEIISGDIISISEISEKLMGDIGTPVRRDARFPEFFGTEIEETSESEGEEN